MRDRDRDGMRDRDSIRDRDNIRDRDRDYRDSRGRFENDRNDRDDRRFGRGFRREVSLKGFGFRHFAGSANVF